MPEPNDKDREVAELAMGAIEGNPLSAKTIIAHFAAQLRFEHEEKTAVFKEKCVSILKESLHEATEKIAKLVEENKISKMQD